MKMRKLFSVFAAVGLVFAICTSIACNTPSNNKTTPDKSTPDKPTPDKPTPSDIEGVWELKQKGTDTYPTVINGKKTYVYLYLAGGNAIQAYRQEGGQLTKENTGTYELLADNKVKLSGEYIGDDPITAKYVLNGNTLTVKVPDNEIKAVKVSSPTAEEMKAL